MRSCLDDYFGRASQPDAAANKPAKFWLCPQFEGRELSREVKRISLGRCGFPYRKPHREDRQSIVRAIAAVRSRVAVLALFLPRRGSRSEIASRLVHTAGRSKSVLLGTVNFGRDLGVRLLDASNDQNSTGL